MDVAGIREVARHAEEGRQVLVDMLEQATGRKIDELRSDTAFTLNPERAAHLASLTSVYVIQLAILLENLSKALLED